MVCVGIDVAKDKHDCFILNSEGEVLADVFTIANNRDGFEGLMQCIRSCTRPSDKIRVGLEATGHYSYNILGFLLGKGLPTFVINPLHTNLYRKSLSLRQTKTDRIDARTIAAMLMIPEVTSNLIIPFVIFAYMLHIDWRLALLSLITVPVGGLFFLLMMRGSQESYQNTVVKTKALNDTAVEYIGGIEVIKAFGKARTSYEKFVTAAKEGAD